MINNQININDKVQQILKDHPELLHILIDLGFKPLANPIMRQSLASITSLKQACTMIGLPLQTLEQTLTWNGYNLVDE